MHPTPLASTSRLPSLSPPSRPRTRSLHLPRIRLNPRTRTRLTNLSFLSVAAVSILTVSLSLGMSNGRVGLPCPARSGEGVGMQEEKGKGRRRWLDDPVVVRKTKVVRAVEREGDGERVGVRAVEAKEGVEGRREGARGLGGERRARDEGWRSWVASAWR